MFELLFIVAITATATFLLLEKFDLWSPVSFLQQQLHKLLKAEHDFIHERITHVLTALNNDMTHVAQRIKALEQRAASVAHEAGGEARDLQERVIDTMAQELLALQTSVKTLSQQLAQQIAIVDHHDQRLNAALPSAGEWRVDAGKSHA